MTAPRPFLKWAGGKQQLLEPILARLPKRIDTYYEPFLGGGAVFFALAAEGRFENAVLSDANYELIETYRAIAEDVEMLIRLLSHYRSTEGEYYAHRESSPSTRVGRAARFIFLNKCCFNGLYRVNKQGRFNVPWCKRENVTIFDAENLRACSAALRRAELHHCDFEVRHGSSSKAYYEGQGDAYYFDPPYLPVSATADFTGYTAEGFNYADHVRLAAHARTLWLCDAHVLISGSDTLATRQAYMRLGFFERVPARRRVAASSASRKDTHELLFTTTGRTIA